MTLSVAILGAGIGREHYAAYLKLPNLFKVLHIVDTDVERARSVAGSAPVNISPDIDTALNDPRVDIIDVCLPPHLHVPISLRALDAGKDVICEKPIATSLSDVHSLVAACQRTGKTVYPVFQYRWGPAHAQLRHLIATGAAGAPQAASIETHWSRGADYYAVPWRGTWAGEQGGAVLGHAIHNHDLLTHFMGPVRNLSAVLTTRVNPIETEDCAAISFEMESGAVATSSITLGAARDETRLRFVFEHLTATSGANPYAPGNDAWIFAARDPANQDHIDKIVSGTIPEPVGFVGFLTEIVKHQADQNNSQVSLDDGRASIELVTAIYHAARTGIRVSLPLPRDHPLTEGWQP